MVKVKVPLVDLKAQYLTIKAELDEAIAHVHERGNYVMGEEVEAFEEEWAAYCGAKYAVGVSCGSDALYLILRYLRQRWSAFQSSNEVVPPSCCHTTPLTFWATIESALRAGYELTFYDVYNKSGLAITEMVRGLERDVFLRVHLYGYPEQIWHRGLQFYCPVVEDSSHAHGKKLEGYAAAFSHYPTKNLGAMGQAGSLVTDSLDLRDWARSARQHSETSKRFEHAGVSGNFRLDELQAAVLRVKLNYLSAWNKQRREIASFYSESLTGLESIQLAASHPEHSYHIYAIRVKEPRKRDDLKTFLEERGIQTGIRYPTPMHLQPYFNQKYKIGGFPEAEAWCREVLNLPIYPELTDGQVEYVTESVKKWEKGI